MGWVDFLVWSIEASIKNEGSQHDLFFTQLYLIFILQSIQRSLKLKFYNSMFQTSQIPMAIWQIKWWNVHNLPSSLIFIGYFVAHNFISNRWIHGSRCGQLKRTSSVEAPLELMTIQTRRWRWCVLFPKFGFHVHHFFIKVLIWLVNHAFLYHFCRCRIEVPSKY